MTDPPDLHRTLAPRAFLHEDPESYLAGVEDALAEAAAAEPVTEPAEQQRRRGAS